MMMKNKSVPRKFMKLITMPKRALVKARDLYVRGMNHYGNMIMFDGLVMGGPVYIDPLTRTMRASAARSGERDDDHCSLTELVRAASTSVAVGTHKVVFKTSILSSNGSARTSSWKSVARSKSVAMDKIDEDEREFEEDEDGAAAATGKAKIRVFTKSSTIAAVL